MVGIAAVASILGKVVEPAIDPVKRHLGYLFCFNSHVETFKDKVARLDDIKTRVQIQVNGAHTNVEIIDPVVKRWLLDAGVNGEESKTIIEFINNFPEGFFGRWFLNLKSRYTLSRKAKKKTKDIIRLCQEGNFERVSFPPQSIQIVVSTSAMNFETREWILNEIIQDLKDENISMIGICGMGGVGKTTMMEMICERVNEQKLFDDFAITVISQNRDIAKIQRDIAEMLKLQLNEQNPKVREAKLHQRLGSSKVLVILDDVWAEFDLKELGITFQGSQKGLKVLFTARELGLWRQLEAKIDHPLRILTNEEAWELFKAKANDPLEDESELQSVAKQIVKECGGLPLALVTIGGALSGRSIHLWRDILRQLKRGYPTKTSGISGEVYQSIEFSYKFLVEKDAKTLFLLCSMFEENSNTHFDDLIRMTMGLRLFKGIIGLEATRDRVFALLEELKIRNLLLPGNNIYDYRSSPFYFRMHDIVLDVARSIAMVKNGALVVDNHVGVTTLCEHDIVKDCAWISIISKDINELPTESKFAQVKLLRCSNTVLQNIGSFLNEMTEIRVLDVDGVGSLLFPSLLGLPNSLRTLFLRNGQFEELSEIEDLPNLESLSFAWSQMKELPIKIGHMTNLLSLDLTGCLGVKTIQPGVISGLRQLQELYMRGILIDWEIGENNKGPNASLREFELLSNLHTLRISIKDARALPRSPIFKNLKKYDIEIGNKLYYSSDLRKACRFCDKRFSIELSIPLSVEGDIKYLSENAEELILSGELTKDLSHRSRSLKGLCVVGMIHSLEHLTVGSFENLSFLEVGHCNMLRSIFQLSVGNKEYKTSKIAFPALIQLKFDNLPNLVSFCHEIEQVEFPQLDSISLKRLPKIECIFSELSNQSLFPHKVSLPRLQSLFISEMENMKEIWCGQFQNSFFCNVTKLGVLYCDKLRAVFTTCMARYLVHLQTLEVSSCSLLEVVIAKGEVEDWMKDTTFLPKLVSVHLTKLPTLENFCHTAHELEYPMLSDLVVVECPQLKTFSPGSVSTPKLNNVKLSGSYAIPEVTLWEDNLNSTISHIYKLCP